MTQYAEVQGQTLIKFPYGFDDLESENPFTNYGSDRDFVSIFPQTDTAIQHGYTLEPVTVEAQPAFDPATQTVTQNDAPTLVNGVWTLGWTVAAMSAEQLAQANAQFAARVNAECARRIYALASDNAQKNMLGNAVAGLMSADQLATFRQSLMWIGSMQIVARKLAAAGDATYADDKHWPACPDAVAALAAIY